MESAIDDPGTGAAPAGDALRHEYTIDTPENVSFRYDVAGIGSRFVGALIDTVILAVLLTVLNIALIFLLGLVDGDELFVFGLEGDIGWAAGLLLALYALFQFAIFWGYYFFFELRWSGQSPGKRLAHTRVVRMDGDPVGFAETAIRNLVRIVDFLPTFYAVGLVTMFCNDKARRLGDFAAGTLVVRELSAIKLESLPAKPADASRPTARPEPDAAYASLLRDADLRRLEHADIVLIRDALVREQEGKLAYETLRRLAELIAARIQIAPGASSPQATRRFLTEVTEAYERRTA